MRTHIRLTTPDETSERAPLAKPGGLVVASPRSCAVCGAALTGPPQQRCCSARCRAAKSRRRRVPLPISEAKEIRAQLTVVLEAVWEAKTTLDEYLNR